MQSVGTIQDRVRGKTERLEAGFAWISTRIHRFPRGLRGIGGPDGRYIIPSVVALGPYHHGLPHLQEMEELKHAAAYYFCTGSGHQTEEVYGKILSIAKEARLCYDEDAVARFSDLQFAEMMYLDGCFLLMYIRHRHRENYPPVLTNGMVFSNGPFILRDIMLLENQIPWLVLEALMTFRLVDVYDFVVHVMGGLLCKPLDVPYRPGQAFGVNEDLRAPHLLGLARVFLTANMPREETFPLIPLIENSFNLAANLSAIRLSEMGFKLKASEAAWFADMHVSKKWRLFGELSISPVFLSDLTACWLINMAAFEARTSIDYGWDGFVVSSYLSLLAFLMDKEEDVHKLRKHHIVTGLLSNQDTLEFFKAIAAHLLFGRRYHAILVAMEHYKRERRVWIVIHRFLYKYWKTIVISQALTSLITIAGALVGIFQALYSMKHN